MTLKGKTFIQSITFVAEVKNQRGKLQKRLEEYNQEFLAAAENNDDDLVCHTVRKIKKTSDEFVKVAAQLRKLERELAVMRGSIKYKEGA